MSTPPVNPVLTSPPSTTSTTSTNSPDVLSPHTQALTLSPAAMPVAMTHIKRTASTSATSNVPTVKRMKADESPLSQLLAEAATTTLPTETTHGLTPSTSFPSIVALTPQASSSSSIERALSPIPPSHPTPNIVNSDIFQLISRAQSIHHATQDRTDAKALTPMTSNHASTDSHVDVNMGDELETPLQHFGVTSPNQRAALHNKPIPSARAPPSMITGEVPGVAPLRQYETSFSRVAITGRSVTSLEYKDVCTQIRSALELRLKFVFNTKQRDATTVDVCTAEPKYVPPVGGNIPPKSDHKFSMVDGVIQVWRDITNGTSSSSSSSQPGMSITISPVTTPVHTCPTRKEFSLALAQILDMASSGPVKSFSFNRLRILEARFNLHTMLNHDVEQHEQKSVPHRDFYNVRKIDNHVHHSACMNQKHLLRFIKYKLKMEPNSVVILRNGQELTLQQVFESLNMTAYNLNIDSLDVHADKTFHRFDKFNLKYNPVGESRLREVFLKYNNYTKGRFLAEITKQVFDDLESNKYQFAEYRMSIYGRDANEWDVLADWIVDNKLFHANVRWMIQVPRLYSIYRQSGAVNSFEDMLKNVFVPLFEVTVDPSSHPKLHQFLQACVGFDMVDDESIREKPYSDNLPLPSQWTQDYDPPYAMFAYYMYANLYTLNQLRESKGMSTFAFRPHAGEAGDIEHLAAAFLLSKSINHGLQLWKSPCLQYLFYLAQIGISMSPLSNNLLFVEYDKNPFPKFFARGLNVTLSTDDPLMIHVTKEPLVEEYSVAAQVWKLTSIDMCEIARNSVLQSGFEHIYKAHWLGNNYFKRGIEGNDIRQTNVPNVRVSFRNELLREELDQLARHSLLSWSENLLDQL